MKRKKKEEIVTVHTGLFMSLCKSTLLQLISSFLSYFHSFPSILPPLLFSKLRLTMIDSIDVS